MRQREEGKSNLSKNSVKTRMDVQLLTKSLFVLFYCEIEFLIILKKGLVHTLKGVVDPLKFLKPKKKEAKKRNRRKSKRKRR